MTKLTLYGHLFSSYTQKALIALYENGTPFSFRSIGPETPENTAEWLKRWPIRKFPLLVDGERSAVETSIIVGYLQVAHSGSTRLLPDDALAALDVRFLDRFFDPHVMNAAQWAVDGALTGNADRQREGLEKATEKLDRAYRWIDLYLTGETWAAGDRFTLADCAAAPSLFYADWVSPIPATLTTLGDYRSRLLARPSFACAVEDARPFRSSFPLGAPDRD
ncbi:glutathione S-transferase family protein [Dyella sp.]|uniref:glutathione S-transferase family protein n=1 Tax=Dyella sp. TaxID=1869338 RepID=UPI002ED4816F